MLLFLSHSGADTAAARDLKARILAAPEARAAQLDVWLDVDRGLEAGGPAWQRQIEDALEQATAFCVYVGSRGVTNWVEREVRVGLSRATGDGAIPFVPALAPGVASRALPPFARQHQAVRDPLGDDQALADLVRAALGRADAPVLVEEPFVGLRAMEESDAHLFFGRRDETDALATKLRAHPIVAVVADSGAGKSSLVRAGLAPAFRGGLLEPADRPQRPGALRHVVVMRPGGDPTEGLRRGVTEAAGAMGLAPDAQAGLRKRIDLGHPPETAYALRCDLPPELTDTLLIVDQLEELVTQTPAAEAQRFIALLMALVDPGAQRRVRIALTVRADYFNLLSAHPALFARLTADGGAAQLRLKVVGAKGLEKLVRKPLRMAGHGDAGEQAALATAIQRDVSDRPGDLALVQMALAASWRRAQVDRIGLTAAYAEVGGVLGALAHEAERVRTEALDAGEQALLFPLLIRLIRLGDAGGATRRPVALADLDEARRALAQKLASEASGRLLAVGEAAVEIAHEALIRQWPWLQRAIAEAGPDLRALARLADAAAAWREGGRAARLLPNTADRTAFEALRSRR
ncbi:TIR domain-containing protein [Rubrimonas cliftonensis]|uniref:TIR domain-containing protein n=1 Tax=Rubrimonas cliftonensis TaxID=89524 RepID=A0A1H3Z143_9RHOB|nr:toll/interleukin-1 receptor domain-containing protein [Rubrimonas cliftonensis]SEA17161.1 TIR domain-containing protein [Rubrimonas cliftonensis]